MWVAVGGTALHYWQGYMAAYDQVVVVREQVVIMHYPISGIRNGFSSKCLYIFCVFAGRSGAWSIVCSVGCPVSHRHCAGIHSFRQVNDT